MGLNRASLALVAHTNLTMEERSVSLVEVVSTQRERDPAPSMTARSKVRFNDMSVTSYHYNLMYSTAWL